jgi:hypothetical protein
MRHAFTPDERAFTELARTTCDDQLLDGHLHRSAATEIDVPELLVGGWCRRGMMGGSGCERAQRSARHGRRGVLVFMMEARQRRATSTA